MKTSGKFALAAILIVAPILLAAQAHKETPPPFPSKSITIVDLDKAKIEISLDDLKAMPRVEEKKCICVGETQGFIGIYDYAGVRLTDVLNKAVAAHGASGYRKENLYLVFRATDQYQVVASWNEIQNTADGQRAMVVLEKDGKPLPEDEGALRLHFPGDKFVGRSVKCLDEIDVYCVDGVVERSHNDGSDAG